MRIVFENSRTRRVSVSSQDQFAFKIEGEQRDADGNYVQEFKDHLAEREKAHSDWAKDWADRMRMVMRLDMQRSN